MTTVEMAAAAHMEQLPLLARDGKKGAVSPRKTMQALRQCLLAVMVVLIVVHGVLTVVHRRSPNYSAHVVRIAEHLKSFQREPTETLMCSPPHENVERLEVAQDLLRVGYRFTAKPGGSDFAHSAGLYRLVEGIGNEINGKPMYVNAEVDRFLAWTGQQWEITVLCYLPGLKRVHDQRGFHPGAFGAFHGGAAGAEKPVDGLWKDFNVKAEVARSVAAEGVGSARKEDVDWQFHFTPRHGVHDPTDSGGIYLRDVAGGGVVNNRPSYVNQEKRRRLFWTGLVWAIAPADQGPGNIHGYYHYHTAATSARPDDAEWQYFIVRRERRHQWWESKGLMAFNVSARPGVADSAGCAGAYMLVDDPRRHVDGKPYFVNMDRSLALTSAESGWHIVPMAELLRGAQPSLRSPQVVGPQPLHVGRCAGGGMRPDCGSWPDYSVTGFVVKHLGATKAYYFAARVGSRNYAACDGLYVVASGEDYELNGKPYYVLEAKQRFLAWTGFIWEITATTYLEGVKKHHAKHGFWPGSFGGFHAGGGAWPDDGTWSEYTVMAEGGPVPVT